MVQVVDSGGNGINGDTLWFKADYGVFEGGYNDFPTVTDTFRYITNEELLSGVSRQPWFIFPNDPHDIVITIEAMKGTNIWATKQVALKCFDDNEISGLNPPKCHETTDTLNKNVEISGDGYNDGTGKKTIRVEIDYASNVLHQSEIIEAIDYMKKILVTAGLDTSHANFIIDEGAELLNPIPTWIIKTYLAGFRDLRDCIHIVIGSKREDTNDFGEVIAYEIPEWGGFTHTRCASLASTDSVISQAYLDSTGILIYADRIWDEWSSQNLDTLWHYHWTPWTKVLGIAMAHEIGHALGITSHPGGVMQPINWQKDANNWMRFLTDSLNSHPPFNTMNTRDVIGIHTIDIGW
ncbi:MAG: hypothetical protein ACUVTF_08975 [bacterium]